MEETREEYPTKITKKQETKVETNNVPVGGTSEVELEHTFEMEIDDEVASTSMYNQYEINSKIFDVFKSEPLSGVITKVLNFRNEELVLRTKILRWTKDVRAKNSEDREYLEFLFKSARKNIPAVMGKLIGNKSGKPYWGISYDFGKGNSLNYAITHGDMRILCDLNVFRKVTEQA